MSSRTEEQRPSQNSHLIASIDTGSNTIRLLIGSIKARKIERLFSDRRITRLGESIKTSGEIKTSRMYDSINCLADFKEKALRLGAERIATVGTAALREARNSYEFVKMVKDKVGLDIEIISPEEEALLTIEGIKAGMEVPGDFVAFDLGGGSTEFIFVVRNDTRLCSIPLGVLKLSDLISSYPPSEILINNTRESVREILSSITSFVTTLKPFNYLIGTGGTVTTLASIDLSLKTYNPAMVHGHRLSFNRINEMVSDLSDLTMEEIARLDGIERGREDIIIPGLISVLEIMHLFSKDELIVSDYGLLEGIIIKEANRVRQG